MSKQEERPLRICDVCGQVDDHPRHVIAYAPGEAPPVNQEQIAAVIDLEGFDGAQKAAFIADLQDTTLQLRHMDCCRSVGCPTGSCNEVPDLRGPKLLAHIQKGSE